MAKKNRACSVWWSDQLQGQCGHRKKSVYSLETLYPSLQHHFPIICQSSSGFVQSLEFLKSWNSLLLRRFVFRKVEASDWWWAARDHGKGTDGPLSPSRLPLRARERRLGTRQVLKFAQQFSRDKILKNGKKSGVFFKLQQVLYNWIFFVFVKSYPISPVRLQCIVKKALFLSFFKVCIDELFDSLEFGKEIIVLEKSLEKVLNFGSKYLYKACLILNVAYRNIFQHLWAFRQLFSNRNICVIVWTSISATRL